MIIPNQVPVNCSTNKANINVDHLIIRLVYSTTVSNYLHFFLQLQAFLGLPSLSISLSFLDTICPIWTTHIEQRLPTILALLQFGL